MMFMALIFVTSTLADMIYFEVDEGDNILWGT